jgi:hypothetical protein
MDRVDQTAPPRGIMDTSGRPTFRTLAIVFALTLAVGGTATAGARALLTGRDVQDESLTGADIQNHTLSGADIRAGSLGSNVLSAEALANLRGAAGATGTTGAPGLQGAPGQPGPQGPAGAGVTARTDTGPDVANYQDRTPLATTSLTSAGDYVLFGTLTAHNTGATDEDFQCGLFMNDNAFGGGGAHIPAGATVTFSTVGATALALDGAEVVTLACQGGGATSYDVSQIRLRTHNLG